MLTAGSIGVSLVAFETLAVDYLLLMETEDNAGGDCSYKKEKITSAKLLLYVIYYCISTIDKNNSSCA